MHERNRKRRRELTSPRWAELRQFILERDGRRCRKCGRAGRLEVDHITPVHHGGAVWDAANLQALCRPCHFAKTRAENAADQPAKPMRAKWRALVAELT